MKALRTVTIYATIAMLGAASAYVWIYIRLPK